MWSFYRGKPKKSTSFTSYPPRPIPPPCGNHLNKLAERTKWICGTSVIPDHKSFANVLNDYFVAVSSKASPPDTALSSSTYTTLVPVLNLSPTTPAWCEETLSTFKPQCATGLDMIPSSTLIAAKSVICYPLCSILNSSISFSVFPQPCMEVCFNHASAQRWGPYYSF